MAKQSALAVRHQKEIQDAMSTAERITRQFDIDTLQIALNRSKLSLGYTRIMEICELWIEVRKEYEQALSRSPETDVARYHLDQEQQRIAGKHMTIIPFQKRYPELKEVTYQGKTR